jgi:hypothetical protein
MGRGRGRGYAARFCGPLAGAGGPAVPRACSTRIAHRAPGPTPSEAGSHTIARPRSGTSSSRETRALNGCIASPRETPPCPPFVRGGDLKRAGRLLFPPLRNGGDLKRAGRLLFPPPYEGGAGGVLWELTSSVCQPTVKRSNQLPSEPTEARHCPREQGTVRERRQAGSCRPGMRDVINLAGELRKAIETANRTDACLALW